MAPRATRPARGRSSTPGWGGSTISREPACRLAADGAVAAWTVAVAAVAAAAMKSADGAWELPMTREGYFRSLGAGPSGLRLRPRIWVAQVPLAQRSLRASPMARDDPRHQRSRGPRPVSAYRATVSPGSPMRQRNLAAMAAARAGCAEGRNGRWVVLPVGA